VKILLSGYHNPHYETVTEYMEWAIRTLGHVLVIYDDRQHVIPGRIRRRVPWAHRMDLVVINRRLLRLARQERPHLAVVMGGERVLDETVQSLKAAGVDTALWTIDAPAGEWSVSQAAPFYDRVFCQGSEAVEILERAGLAHARWLPVGCDPSRHYSVTLSPEEKEQYGYDVAFVGSWYPERAALFERLCDFDLAIWGPGWEMLPERSALRQHLRGAHTSPGQWRKIYSASRIVLATHYHDPSGRYPVYQASPRVFEALACGAFVLCDRQRDVLALFRDGEHLASFSDVDDLAAKVRYYLEHPEERQAIARKGREEVLAHHTYSHRIETMLTRARGN
jgi:spore maturation protein CgeB